MKLSADKILLGVLLAIGLATHFVHLSWPPQVVFDEVHFGKFVTAYCCTGERFFDIHPPHAKLLITAAAWIGGYRGGFSFANIGQPYGDVPAAALRFVPALSGVLLPLLLYWVMRRLNMSRAAAFAGGWLVLWDNSLTVQTRVIALDGVLLAAQLGCLGCYLKAEAGSKWRRYAWLVLAGTLGGLAVGTKFTGLAALALVGLMLLVELVRKFSLKGIKRFIGAGVVLGISAAVVYFAGWMAHFALLPLPGSGDAFQRPDFSQGLWINNFAREVTKLQKVMLSANYGLKAEHPYASPWWSWPIMERSVFYWEGLPAGGLTRFIYFLGNPLVWWGSTALLLTAVTLASVWFGQRAVAPPVKKPPVRLWVPAAGFLIAIGPMIRIPRALFLYHYLTPLLFALMIGLGWLDILILRQMTAISRRVYFGALVAVVLVFIIFSPLTYGLAVPAWWRDNLFWLKSWR